MDNKTADVIVVGCGPIGAYAAWQFAQRGLKVIALEKEMDAKPASTIGAFHFERFAFDENGIPLPPDEHVICKYPGMTIHAPDLSRSVYVDGVETWAMDLVWFIDELRSMAKKAGAVVLSGQQVSGPISKGNRVVGVKAKGARGNTDFLAPVVVDATGTARALRRHIPVFQLPLEGLPFSVYMEYWSKADSLPGRGIHSYLGPNAWTAQYPDYWIVGMGQPKPMEKTVADHAEWVARHLPGDREIIRSVKGTSPYSFFPPTMVDQGVLLIGDAAATNKPFNGEGISSGMALVRIAAEVLPKAVAQGGTRRSLWEINRRYFSDIGSKFAFLRSMGFSLLDQTDKELAEAFEIGLLNGRDLQQTFVHYKVDKPLSQWVVPLTRLLRRRKMAGRYAAALFHAARMARMVEHYPVEDDFPAWRDRYVRLISSFRKTESLSQNSRSSW